jgi:hypothetical protein
MNDEQRRIRTIWAVARYAQPTFYLAPHARCRVALFVPDANGAEHSDIEHLRRFFLFTPRGERPIGSEHRGSHRDRPGVWFNVHRLGSCEWVAARIRDTAAVWKTDAALWKSFAAVLQCAPSRKNGLSPDARKEMIAEFNRMRGRKQYRRDPYPDSTQIDKVTPSDPTENLFELVHAKPKILTPARKSALNLRDAKAKIKKLEKERDFHKDSHKALSDLLDAADLQIGHLQRQLADLEASCERRIDAIRHPKDSYLTRHPERASIPSNNERNKL